MLFLFIFFLSGNSVKYLKIWTWWLYIFRNHSIYPFGVMFPFRVNFAAYVVLHTVLCLKCYPEAKPYLSHSIWTRWFVEYMQYRAHWHRLSKDKFGCPLCQKGLDIRLKGLSSGQRSNNPLKMCPCYLKAFMNKWLFTYFCLSGSLVHDVRLGPSPFSLPFCPCVLSKPKDVRVDHPHGSRVVRGRGE